MMPSLYSGVSGLKNHNIRMNVIGNNISNVNTYGFKYSRVSFQDLLYQTLSGAAGPTDDKGGVNPKQYGLGARIASIDKIFQQGSMHSTSNPTDLAIQGEGFFIVVKGAEQFYTRAGKFDYDRDGTLYDPANGLKVQGWKAQEDAQGNSYIDPSSSIGDIVIPKYHKLPARATTETYLKSNLNTAAEIGTTVRTSLDVYDSEGESHLLDIVLEKTNVLNQWQATVNLVGADTPILLDITGAEPPTAGANNQIILNFDPRGRLLNITDTSGNVSNTGELIANLRTTIPGREPVNINVNIGTVDQLTGVTQYAGASTTKLISQNGYTLGYLGGLKTDDSGIITGSYTNGQKQILAQVSLAVFTNPGGLNAVGETMFAETNNSGMAIVGEPDTGGRGKIQAGSLEMSNVDLAEQFTDMIVTQRGFQANSRVITTSDQMIQELLSLKR